MASNTPITFDGIRYEIRGIRYEKVDGVIAFLDALGVRGIWETKDPTEVLKNWDNVYHSFSDTLRPLSINLSLLSDTLIISMSGHKELIAQPWRFIEILASAIIPAFVRSMHYDFFFRGVIAMGNFYRSSRMLIGPAVDEAAKLFDISNWIGISVSTLTALILEKI